MLFVILLILIALPLWGTEPDASTDFEAWREYRTQSRFERNPVGVIAILLSPIAAIGTFVSGIVFLATRNKS